jgi:branched-chain amino acid transport system permease protein
MASYVNSVLILTGINLVAVIGLTILTGFAGLFSTGHAGFMAIGAYTAAIASLNLGCPFPVSLLAGGITATLMGLLIGYPTLKNKLSGDYFAIAMLGFGEAVKLAFLNLKVVGGAQGLSGIPLKTNLVWVAGICIVGIWGARNLVNSQYGKNLLVLRDQELAAEALGIDVFKHKLIAMLFSAFYAGIAGGLYAHFFTYLQPEALGSTKSTEILVPVVLGGVRSLSGPILAALLLGIGIEMLRAASFLRIIAYALCIILIMLFRPEGLMGGREITIEGTRKFLARVYARIAKKPVTKGR